MEWLTPWIGLYAAAVAVPALLLLYFLKLKRQETVVSSTLLWKRAVQDLQVNAPFQRLRRNLLLLLQLLVLASVLLALAGPVLAWRGGPGRRYVLLIDRSASMNATDVVPSRLDEARRQAKAFVQSMRGGSLMSLGDSSDTAMIVAFDEHAKVMCNFTADKRRLEMAIDAVDAGDGQSRLGEAVTMARAFSQSSGSEDSPAKSQPPVQLVLFSDGRITDFDTVVVTAKELVFRPVGQSPDNVAVTAMSARRSYERPEQVEVFASLDNYGSEPIDRDVQVSVNNDVTSVRTVRIPAAVAATEAGRPPGSGKATLDLALSLEGSGVLGVRLLGDDALSCDDAAWIVLDPPRRQSVLLVTRGNPVLESALRACPIARLDPCTPAGFDAMDPAAFASRQPYDVIVLDNHIPAHLPRCRYLVFGAPPRGIDVNSPRQIEKQIIVDWRSQHPVLQYVNLANLFATQCHELLLPRDAEVLAEFGESPALALVRRNGSVCLLAGFDILQSNWAFEPGFVLFCYNALAYLGAQTGGDERRGLAVGEPIAVDDVPPGAVVTITRPDASTVELSPDPAAAVRFPGTQRVGVYGIEIAGRPKRFCAVNLLDPEESRIEPQKEVSFSDVTIQAQQGDAQRANVPLWPALVFAALALACAEWLAYNLRVRI